MGGCIGQAAAGAGGHRGESGSIAENHGRRRDYGMWSVKAD